MFNISFVSVISVRIKYLKKPLGHSLLKNVYFDWLKEYIVIGQSLLDILLQDDDLDWLHSQKKSKEEGMESKKRFIYVNPTIKSDTHVAFALVLLQHFRDIYWLLFVSCFLKSVHSLSNRHWKFPEFIVQNVRILTGMSGIFDLRLDWQRCRQ